MKKSAIKSTAVKSTLTAEQKKANRNEAARNRRAAKKANGATLAQVIDPQASEMAVEQFAENVAEMLVNGATAEQIDAEVGEIVITDPAVILAAFEAGVVEGQLVKGSPEWATAEARTFLGETAIVWVVTEDAKGNKFTAPRYRVGLPADKDTGHLIESGRKMIGAGASYIEAVKDARKRTSAKAAA